MSYKTNPIANRLNINKGWISANFPENLSFYARDNVFFFKLYLFLKSYFTLRNIKLISCQIRYGQDYVPVLYLILNTTTRRKKRRSSMRSSTLMYLRPTTRAGFKSSPLRNPLKIEALTLMFSDQHKLKKIFNAYLLPLTLQKPSQLWLTKPRRKTWLNLVAKIRKGRAQFLRQSFNPTQLTELKNFKSKIQSSWELKLSRTMKEFLLLTKILKVVTNHRNLKTKTLTFYKQRLEQLSQSIQTLNSILIKLQPRAPLQKKTKLRNYQKERARKLIIQFQQKQFKFFQQILKKSQFYETNLNWLQKKPHRAEFFSSALWKKFWRSSKKKLRKSKFWKQLAKQQLKSSALALIRNQSHLKKLILKLFTLRRKLEKCPQRNRSTIFNLRTFPQNPDWTNVLVPKILSFRRKEAFRNKLITQLNNSARTRLRVVQKTSSQKSLRPVFFRQFQQLRFKKKMPLNLIDRTKISSDLINRYHFQTKEERFNQTSFTQLKKSALRTRTRVVSARKPSVLQPSVLRDLILNPSALKHLVLKPSTLKNLARRRFALKDSIRKHLARRRLVRKLKNQRYRTRTYRQSFRNIYKKHLNLLVRYQYKLWIQKVLQIFLKTRFEVKFTQPLTQFKNFKFLRLVYPLPTFRPTQQIEFANAKHNLYSAEEKFLGKRYVYLGTDLKRFKLLKKQQQLNHSALAKQALRTRKRVLSAINRNTYSFHKKVDLFKRLRRKKLTDYTQRRLGSIKKQLLMRQFAPILSLCIKYLNPQILADHLAKEFEKTKKHRPIIFALKTALRSLKFARGIGYRIAIVGRINSSTKSRAFYFTKKNLRRQNFEQKINYATAQAKARIGAFGIKVWLFY